MTTIEGEITGILFQNPDNGYGVLQLREKTKLLPTTITGTLPNVRLGEYLICEGQWIEHKKFGTQFEVQQFQIQMPTSLKGMLNYLGGGFIAGVKKRTAQKILDVFGLETFQIIENEPERLFEVQGLGKQKIQQIIDAWAEQHQAREIMIFLQQHSISTHFAQRIYKQYGKQSVLKLKQNPYCLAEDMIGVGFIKADEVALNMGMGKEADFRLQAGLLFMLKELSKQEGHSCYPLEELSMRAAGFLGVEMELIEANFSALLQQKRIYIGSLELRGKPQPFVWLRLLHRQELAISDNLQRLLSASGLGLSNIGGKVDKVCKELNLQLAPQQKEAVELGLKSKFHIITGGAGTGKSTIINVLCKIFLSQTDKLALCAPTGRAAKRLNEITKENASTLHLYLGYNQSSEDADSFAQKVDAEVVIVDEASMVDTSLMAALLRALSDKCVLILVGDADQLPSVGAGNILKDLMDAFPERVSRLTEIFRQSAASQIISYAHSVRMGQMPNFENKKTDDCFFIEEQNRPKLLDLIHNLNLQRLPSAYQFHWQKDIQIISPMNKGELGTRAINEFIQTQANPERAAENGLLFAQTWFCLHDKVIQTRNDYDKGVFNGDIGYVCSVNKSDNKLWVLFDGKEVEYSLQNCIDLDLAYAISVHKFQGSECPAVLIVLHESHFKLLYRNLLYTALTRGKKLVIVAGSLRAFQRAVENTQSSQRFTGLLQHINRKNYQQFPPIRHVPMLGSADYQQFITKNQLL